MSEHPSNGESQTETPLAVSMTKWSVGLRALGRPGLASQIDQDKLISLGYLDALNLPQYEYITCEVSDFLNEPDSYFEQLDRPHYFAILSPTTSSLERKREGNLKKPEIREFISRHIGNEQMPSYKLLLFEEFPQYFGGNVICGDDGSVTLEMLEGPRAHNDLVGGKVPTHFAQNNPFTGRFSYSFDDPDLKNVVWQTIACIPRVSEGGHAPGFETRELLSGYYEFFLIRRSDDAPLEPIFIDYSPQDAYKLKKT